MWLVSYMILCGLKINVRKSTLVTQSISDSYTLMSALRLSLIHQTNLPDFYGRIYIFILQTSLATKKMFYDYITLLNFPPSNLPPTCNTYIKLPYSGNYFEIKG